MKLQQLRYFIAVAESDSIGEASRALFTSQSSLSTSIKELERELGIIAFNRSNRGLTLTQEGIEALSYARHVIAHADNMEHRFIGSKKSQVEEKRLSVTAQHYPFCSEIFLESVKNLGDAPYSVSLLESPTKDVIESVRKLRSEVGVLYFDKFNESAIRNALKEANLTFNLLTASPVYAAVSTNHDLAEKENVSLKELEGYPRLTYEQKTDSSFFFYEEPFSDVTSRQSIVVSDHGTILYFLANSNAYTLCSSASKRLGTEGLRFIPVETDNVMMLGYVTRENMALSEAAQDFLVRLNRYFGREERASGISEGKQ